MNGKQTDVQIIRDMLKMGTATEASMQYCLGLEEEDFDRYRRHVLRRGFATETIDPTPRILYFSQHRLAKPWYA